MKILNSLLIFFNQNDYPISREDFYNMQVDDITTMYELLLEQSLQKKKAMDMIK